LFASSRVITSPKLGFCRTTNKYFSVLLWSAALCRRILKQLLFVDVLLVIMWYLRQFCLFCNFVVTILNLLCN
jgi:hypothetical protein